MRIDTTYLQRCILTLDRSLSLLNKTNPTEIEYDMYRSACIKEFEIIIELTGKLLKKCLKHYFHSSKAVDQLYFKDIFRQAAKHGLLTINEVERWLVYRDNRNTTAHDYGIGFAKQTLKLLPDFIADADKIVKLIEQENDRS